MKRLSIQVFSLLVVEILMSPVVLAEIVHFDDFEYVADRDDPSAGTAFVNHGWSGVKSQQTSGSGAGWLYTTTNIDQFSGAFPGQNSSRVLAIEARARTFGWNQTDFYLEYGNAGGPANAIPGDVWFQFWLYPNRTAAEPSEMIESKFLYMCNDDFPCHSHLWMMVLLNGGGYPSWSQFPGPADLGLYNTDSAGVSEMYWSQAESYNQGKLGQNVNNTASIAQNRWTLVKLHMDTTQTSGNGYEAWIRPYGGSWVKVADWRGGITPGGFSWSVPSANVGGHRVMRMPTTVGGADGPGFDMWLYMDDFTIATSESDLPVYSDEVSTAAPMAPALQVR
jgi:hypothetical protein